MAKIDYSKYGAKPVDLSKYGAQPVQEGEPVRTADEVAPIPVVPPAPPQHPGGLGGQALANLRGTSQGLTSNWGDEALGWLVSKFPSLNISAERLGEQWGDIMDGRIPRASDAPPPMSREQATQYFRERNKASEAAFPMEFTEGQIQGGILQAVSPLGKVTPLGQSGTGAAVASGALAGLGAAESNDPEALAGSALMGGALGGVAQTGGTLVGRGIGKIPDKVQNFLARQKFVTPTPEAEFLMKKGVPLTLGQMDPGSTFGQAEAVSTSVGGLGEELKNMRGEGVTGWQRAAMDTGLPPGMDPAEPGMTLAEQQARAYGGFKEAYAPTKGIEVPPYATEAVPGRTGPSGEQLQRAVSMETGFERAAQDPNVTATADIRESVDRFLKNQMTLLPPEAFDPGGRVTVGTLQTLRSNVRDQLRKALSGSAPNYEKAGLLANAEEYLTGVMEAGMTPEQRAAMQAIDKQYATHKVLQDALARAKDRPAGFTPSMLQDAIFKSSEVGGYTRGELGGELRAIEQAGQKVFQDPPRTGERIMFSRFPNITASAVYGANVSPTMRATMLGRILSDPARVQAMGKYGEQLARAAARGDDDLAVEHFVLSQTDPEYQRLLREQQGATTP